MEGRLLNSSTALNMGRNCYNDHRQDVPLLQAYHLLDWSGKARQGDNCYASWVRTTYNDGLGGDETKWVMSYSLLMTHEEAALRGAGPVWGWRWPFVIVALPAVACASLMMLTTREPPHGATEEALQVRPPACLIALSCVLTSEG